MAKVRTLGMYNSGRNQLTSDLLDTLAKGNVREKNAAQYGHALQALQAKEFASKTTKKIMRQPLLAQQPEQPVVPRSVDGYRSGAEQKPPMRLSA